MRAQFLARYKQLTKKPRCGPDSLTSEAKLSTRSLTFHLAPEKAKVEYISEPNNVHKLSFTFSPSSYTEMLPSCFCSVNCISHLIFSFCPGLPYPLHNFLFAPGIVFLKLLLLYYIIFFLIPFFFPFSWLCHAACKILVP